MCYLNTHFLAHYQQKPELTGWAQINGRDEISNEEKIKLEVAYLEKKSFLFDVKIFTSAFLSKGVSH